jgi:phage terminase Nu1 subunit (DNA packaging protein)
VDLRDQLIEDLRATVARLTVELAATRTELAAARAEIAALKEEAGKSWWVGAGLETLALAEPHC